MDIKAIEKFLLKTLQSSGMADIAEQVVNEYLTDTKSQLLRADPYNRSQARLKIDHTPDLKKSLAQIIHSRDSDDSILMEQESSYIESASALVSALDLMVSSLFQEAQHQTSQIESSLRASMTLLASAPFISKN